MKNIDLNFGGVVGSLVCGGIAITIIYPTLEPGGRSRLPYTFILLGFVGGAFAGNYLWGLIFGNRRR